MPPCFSTIFTKGDNFYNFLVASLESLALQKWNLLLKERICSYGSKFFPLSVDSTEKGGKK